MDIRPITIYKLSAEGKDYYGSTVLPLVQRVQIHTRDANCQSYKNGISTSKDLKWEVMEVTTKELRAERENYYIRNYPCVNKLGKKVIVVTEDVLRKRANSARWRQRHAAEILQKQFQEREKRKQAELEKKQGIKIRNGVIQERPMCDNLPKMPPPPPPAEPIDPNAPKPQYYEVPNYMPFGVEKPASNELYHKHKDYVEGLLAELTYKTKEQTYMCNDCNKRLASSAPVVLRRHFCSYKHLINSGQMKPEDKPSRERKPVEALQQSFQQSLDDGYIFN